MRNSKLLGKRVLVVLQLCLLFVHSTENADASQFSAQENALHADTLPSEPQPPSTANVSPTTLTVAWAEVEHCDSYQVRYKSSNETAWLFSEVVSTPEVTLKELHPNTTYHVSVKGHNSLGWGEFSEAAELSTSFLVDVGPPVCTDLPSLTNVTFDSLQDLLNMDKGSDCYLLVRFHADWCYFSAEFAPVFEALCAAAPTLRTFTYQVNRFSMSTNSKHGIVSFPSLVLFKGGVKEAKYTGPRTLEALAAFIVNETGIEIDMANLPSPREVSFVPPFDPYLYVSIVVTIVFALAHIRSLWHSHLRALWRHCRGAGGAAREKVE